jgi:hypothetical protein
MTALAALAAAFALAAPGPPRLSDVRVSNGDTPYAGDHRLLATVSPNGDGFRERAVVRFRLDRAARVRMEAVRTDTIRPGRPAVAAIWRTQARLPAGRHRLVWRPARTTPARTYVLRLTVVDRLGRARVYDNARPGTGSRRRAPVVRVQSIEAGFTRRSYAPGEVAELRIASDARSLRIQVFTFGNQTHPTPQDLRTSGLAMTPAVRVDWTRHRRAPARLQVVRAGEWASGLYFLRLTAGDGRVGYAPLIVRPRRLGTSRVAVVLSTNTWQAYNFADEDGDGWGDSWYVSDDQRRVDLERPYLDFGVPFRFRDWDLTFVSWLNRTGKRVDYLSDDDLERATAVELAAAYDLIVFPGHAEYVTARAYDVVQGFRDRGGNLMFLSANNFFWRVERDGSILRLIAMWRDLGRPEAALVGVQYVAYGSHLRGPYVVRRSDAAPWLFRGTGLRNGSSFGSFGIEVDRTTGASPRGVRVLAEIRNGQGRALTGQMTYYTRGNAKVFATGAFTLGGSATRRYGAALLENLWRHMTRG